MNINQQVVSYENKNKQSILLGVTAGIIEADRKMEIETGEMFSASDDASLRQVAVLGKRLKEDLFGDAEAVGKNIKVKGQSYRVVGVLKERGTAVGMFNFDDMLYLPLETLQKKIVGINYIQSAIFELKDMKQLELTLLSAQDIMREQHNITDPDDDDFAVNSIVEILDILNTVFLYVNILLIALTSISLVVGGVGIMNVMYVSVTERTFEIGLKKAVGARRESILAQFLFEAIFITLIGGLIGLVFGFMFSELGEMLAARFGFDLRFEVTTLAAGIAIGFSAATGILFGYWPARRASLLSPVEALRKE
jgi:putative ABC transport system permease protein